MSLEERAKKLLEDKQDTVVTVEEGQSLTVAFLRAMGLDAAADESERMEKEAQS